MVCSGLQSTLFNAAANKRQQKKNDFKSRLAHLKNNRASKRHWMIEKELQIANGPRVVKKKCITGSCSAWKQCSDRFLLWKNENYNAILYIHVHLIFYNILWCRYIYIVYIVCIQIQSYTLLVDAIHCVRAFCLVDIAQKFVYNLKWPFCHAWQSFQCLSLRRVVSIP